MIALTRFQFTAEYGKQYFMDFKELALTNHKQIIKARQPAQRTALSHIATTNLTLAI